MTPMYTVWAASHFEQQVFILANLLVCACIVFAVICRSRMMSKSTTRKPVVAFYVGLTVAAVSSGLSYALWDEIPGPGQLSASTALLMFLLVSSRSWRYGQPSVASKD